MRQAPLGAPPEPLRDSTGALVGSLRRRAAPAGAVDGGVGATGQQRCTIFSEERCLQRRGGQTQEVRQRNERQEAEARIRGCSDRDAAAAQCAVATVHLSEGEPGSEISAAQGSSR